MDYQIVIVFVCYILYFEGIFGFNRSEDCILKSNGENATCVLLSNCNTAKMDIKLRLFPQICSFKGKMPVVCCKDFQKNLRDGVYDYDYVEEERNCGPLQTAPKTGRKAIDKCREYQEQLFYRCETLNGVDKWQFHCSFRIKGVDLVGGGVDAKRGQFPHMVMLGYGTSVNLAEWLCGGSIISDRFILTAGHCISSPSLGPVKYAALGVLKRSDPIKTRKIEKIKNVHKYPEFNPPSKYNDIALLETYQTIIWNEYIVPACLHIGDEVRDDKASATGWGALGHMRENADVLQEVPLWKVMKETCSAHYQPHRLFKQGYNHTTQMCYGDDGIVRDTCSGDSGGPLQISNEKISCMYTIVGVTSFGRDCGRIGYPGIYTRVSYYVPWIESVVWP